MLPTIRYLIIVVGLRVPKSCTAVGERRIYVQNARGRDYRNRLFCATTIVRRHITIRRYNSSKVSIYIYIVRIVIRKRRHG